MSFHRLAFAVAMICAVFAWAAPMSWPRHALLIVAALCLLTLGLALTVGSTLLDIIHPSRNRKDGYSARDLNRAYQAGHDTGAAEGPTDATRRRWAREGFEVPSPGPFGR